MTVERVAQSLRLLKRHKRFTTMAIACLGLAVGLNTTMYSVLDAVIRPGIDLREPERLYFVFYYGDYRGLIPPHDRNEALRNEVTFHEGATYVAYAGSESVIERGANLREVGVNTVAPNYFTTLGAKVTAGRLLNENDVGATPRPVIIQDRLWEQLFPDVEEFTPSVVRLNGVERLVVGTVAHTADLPGAPDVWQVPTAAQISSMRYTLFRLRPGITETQVMTELNTLAMRFRQRTGEGNEAGFRIESAVRPPYFNWGFQYALIGSVAAVLLIACANLANLQLARGVSRARELATRSAVGASRSDIVWQLVLESAWLALGGLILGAVLTWWGIELIEASIPKAVAQYMPYPQVSWRVFVFAILATLLCLSLVGLLPAVRLSRVDLNQLLKNGSGTGKTVSARRQYGALVIAEVALALALLCSAGLLGHAAMQVFAWDQGEDYRGIVYAGARVHRAHPGDATTRRAWSETLIRQALAADSITGAATLGRACPSRKAIATYSETGEPRSFFAPLYCYSVVSADFFRVSRIKIVQGRDFSPGEFGEPQVIVDSVAARLMWPGRSPIGQQIKLDSSHVAAPWYRVVGVMRPPPSRFRRNQDMAALDRINSRERMKAQGQTFFVGEVYVLNAFDTVTVPLPGAQRNSAIGGGLSGGTYINLVVSGRGDPRRLPVLLRDKLAELGPNVAPSYGRTWEQAQGIDVLRAKHGFVATLFGLFAFFALVLAALGVYAIIAHMVAQRTREFGVRIAVGAGERDIRQMVMREGNILTLAGIAIGLLITYKSGVYLRAFLFSDWDRFDSRVFAVVALVLFASAWLASYLPARRAMRINPVEALRND